MKTIVFVDYWNLQLLLQSSEAEEKGLAGAEANAHRFDIAWFSLGPILTELADRKASPTDNPLGLAFQEMRIYTSNDPNDDGKYKKFVTQTLGAKPGIFVSCLERKPKRNKTCPACHNTIDRCPHCQHAIIATQEKGVDTLLVTDLLRLGLDHTYEVAILVSQDADMCPAVEHLAYKGIKVIHVGIKHFGNGIANKSWASFDIFPLREKIKRQG